MSTNVALSSMVWPVSTIQILFFINSVQMSLYVNIYLTEFQTSIYRQTRYTAKIPASRWWRYNEVLLYIINDESLALCDTYLVLLMNAVNVD